MLISEAIEQANVLTGQSLPAEALVRWLSEMDGRLAFEFYRAEGWLPYDPVDDMETELLVPFPWDGMYVHHLEAMTYFTNAEYDRYENARTLSEKALADFRAFMQRTQAKLCGCGFPTEKTGGTYTTVIPEKAQSPWFWVNAYSLAVQHGFAGTEDEWLESLVGPKGDKGDPYTILGLYPTLAALEAAHPAGEAGDAYAVGDEDENTTYNWDVDAEAWVNIGPFRGPQGETGETGATGAAAGFGTVSATVDGNTGTPGVNVSTSGPDTAKNIAFEFVNLKGETGATGAPGADGVSPGVTISEIAGGHSVTFTDADHPSGQSFNVMDGEDGADGDDGVSPGVSVSTITGGHAVTITDAEHPSGQSFNVMDGADGTSFVIKGLYATYADLIAAHPTGSAGDAYAVGTSSSNTTYIWDVDENNWTNIGSIQGPPGQDGQDGQDGAPGQDGVSPEVSVSSITGGHSVTITDADHPSGQTFNVMDGEDGAPGQDGQDGQDGEPGPNEVSSSTDTALNGVLFGNGSKVGAKSLDTSSLTNDNNHVPTSGVVKSALDNLPIENRPLIIVDTDWWTDCDDAVALNILIWAEQQGMCDILGLVVDSVNSNSATTLSRFLNYEGRGDLPFALEKNATDYSGTPSYFQTIISNWAYAKYADNAQCVDENNGEYYVSLLQSIPEGKKCTIVTIGYLSALAGLFNRASQDQNVMALVTSKVEKIFCMAGAYPQGSENNFTRNARSRQAGYDVCTKCPSTIPIIFLGFEVGETVLSGGTTGAEIGTFDLLYKILVAHGEGASGRSSWDPMTVLLALINDPDASGYTLVRGTNSVNASTGVNTFTVSSNGSHYYVVKKYPDAWYSHQINTIVNRIGWKYRQEIGKYQYEPQAPSLADYIPVTLDGDENWQFNTSNEPNTYGYYNCYLLDSNIVPPASSVELLETAGVYLYGDGFCDNPAFLNVPENRTDTNKDGWGYFSVDPSIYFRFNSSIATSVASFKQYLSQNPMTIYLKRKSS